MIIFWESLDVSFSLEEIFRKVKDKYMRLQLNHNIHFLKPVEFEGSSNHYYQQRIISFFKVDNKAHPSGVTVDLWFHERRSEGGGSKT